MRIPWWRDSSWPWLRLHLLPTSSEPAPTISKISPDRRDSLPWILKGLPPDTHTQVPGASAPLRLALCCSLLGGAARRPLSFGRGNRFFNTITIVFDFERGFQGVLLT